MPSLPREAVRIVFTKRVRAKDFRSWRSESTCWMGTFDSTRNSKSAKRSCTCSSMSLTKMQTSSCKNRVLALLLVALAMPAISRAVDADMHEVARELGAVLAWRLGPESVEEQCRSADPAGVAIRKKALKDWLDKNAPLIKDV